jgi:hypothetical protein
VFGRFTIGTALLQQTATPRSFDYQARARALAIEQSTGLDSPRSLAPARWAAAAVHIRDRMNDLIRWAFLSVVAVLLYTVAEVTTRKRVAWAALGCGLAVYLTALVGALSTVFFSA